MAKDKKNNGKRAARRRRRQISTVKVNELPDDLLEIILTCMSIQDAIRTSVLSRRWQNIWKRIPKIIFNDRFCTPLIRSSGKELFKVIYDFFLLHDGRIVKFSIDLSNMSGCSEIDLLHVVSDKGVKELDYFINDESYGSSWSSLWSTFSCQQLEHLSLCTFFPFQPPAGFKGFSKLISLDLYEISNDGKVFSSIIHRCPLLERLSFYSSTMYDRVDLFAPNLKYLQFCGLSRFLCFKNTPKLATIGLWCNGGVIEELEQFLLCGKLPGVEYLELDEYYAEFMAANQALTAYMCNLKSLCLYNVFSDSW